MDIVSQFGVSTMLVDDLNVETVESVINDATKVSAFK